MRSTLRDYGRPRRNFPVLRDPLLLFQLQSEHHGGRIINASAGGLREMGE